MEQKLGIYIHIPFCASKCGYCDFHSLAGCDDRMAEYQDALLLHIRESADRMEPYYIDSVYFGGGTPSYYGAKRICEIFNTLKLTGQVLKSAEVTVEMNPDSMTEKDLRMLRKEGINRVSIGVQSANDDLLKLIGRRHTFRQAEQAVAAARSAGFRNISLDLIYGLPTQTKKDWADTLGRVMALRPEHISCYGLKLEKGTPMYDSYRNSALLPTDDEQADMYLYTVETLQQYGYQQYEISNFAFKGKESRHNLKYWNVEDYMGFGSGAHSYVNHTRYSYVRDVEAYIDGINEETSILDEYEYIDHFEHATEYIMLGMRRNRGISQEEYKTVYSGDFTPIAARLQEFEQKGWAVKEGDRWHFTSSGFLLSNLLIESLLEVQAEERTNLNPWAREAFENSVKKKSLPEGEERFFHQ
ncbi:MAG: radical SAM family heme chaperone HemW [Oscillospiraceae bacterium]|jgi:putative oxygen-independent coproporphyrinogen III oxidase